VLDGKQLVPAISDGRTASSLTKRVRGYGWRPSSCSVLGSPGGCEHVLVRSIKQLFPHFGPVGCNLSVTDCRRRISVRSDSAVSVIDAGVTHTRRHFYIRIPLLAHSILLVGAVALALFVVGPQAGSVDDDGDGNPDIPVVVSDLVLVAHLSPTTRVDQRSGNIQDVKLSRSLRIPTRYIEIAKCGLSSFGDASGLCRCLRC
jgi:hypothetical protein